METYLGSNLQRYYRGEHFILSTPGNWLLIHRLLCSPTLLDESESLIDRKVTPVPPISSFHIHLNSRQPLVVALHRTQTPQAHLLTSMTRCDVGLKLHETEQTDYNVVGGLRGVPGNHRKVRG